MSQLSLEELRVTSFVTSVEKNKVRGGETYICLSNEAMCETANTCVITRARGTGGCCRPLTTITVTLIDDV